METYRMVQRCIRTFDALQDIAGGIPFAKLAPKENSKDADVMVHSQLWKNVFALQNDAKASAGDARDHTERCTDDL
jgi:hypothetical protein